LKQLRNFPTHKLKIGQKFVCGVLEDWNDPAMVRVTIDLARIWK
jgi:EAL domain-containing protein (putative c-di-GMP-specific phosphodiesterase class I)